MPRGICCASEVNEGLLGSTMLSAAPLGTEYAEAWLNGIAGELPHHRNVKIHVSQGNRKRMLGKLLRQSQAEMLMVSRQSALQYDFFGTELNRTLEDSSSAFICVTPGLQRPIRHYGRACHC